jgi:hypothetical protein
MGTRRKRRTKNPGAKAQAQQRAKVGGIAPRQLNHALFQIRDRERSAVFNMTFHPLMAAPSEEIKGQGHYNHREWQHHLLA